MSSNFEKARTYFQQSNFSRCLKICKKIIGSDPTFLGAYLLGAQAALAMGQKKQTEKLLLRAIHLQPENAVVHRNFGIFLNQIAREEEAERAFRRALEIDPQDPESLYCYAVHLQMQDRILEARDLFFKASDLAPENASIWTGLATAQRSLGKFEAARESCLAALEFDPKNIPALNDLGALSVELEDYSNAIMYFERAVSLNPKQPRAWFNLGSAYQRAERSDEAVTAYIQAHNQQPDSAEILEALGRTFLNQGKYEKAIQTFLKGCQIAPDYAQMSYYLACGHIGARNLDEARAVCTRFLDRHPGDATTTSCLALIAAEHGPKEEDERYNCFDTIIHTVKVTTPASFADESTFINELANHILNHPTLRDGGQQHATRNGLHTGNLRLSGMGPLGHLEAFIARSLDDYVAFLRQTGSNEFIASRRPKEWFLDIWGVAMNKQGHQIPHFHPQSWVSGCFYAKLPPVVSDEDGDHAGWIEFGAPPRDFLSLKEYKVKAYQPIVGSMFLFPGYLTHRTIPFDSNDVRISIAFDVVPK